MNKTDRKKRSWWRWGLALVGMLLVAWGAAGAYFFHVAMVPSHKSFVSSPTTVIKKSDPLYQQKRWFQQATKQKWTMTAADGQTRLVAAYLPAAQPTTKSVIILHGFMQNKESMGAYAALFHQLGYNVLLPDARAHGQSQGHYIGYGWPERYDVRKWAKRLIRDRGPKSQIVIFGVSMGGATTMMTSGLQLPAQVKALVADCGYSSLQAELDYQAGHLYHLPMLVRIPVEGALSVINRVANGFFTQSASSTRALHHNHRPLLLIHGAADDFVPTKMVWQNYRATQGPKQIWVVPHAGHAKAYATSPAAYRAHLQAFLAHYVK